MAPRYLVGLTGNAASGKSAVARILHDDGVAVLGYDDVRREQFPDPTCASAVQAIVPFPVILPSGGLDVSRLKQELLTRPDLVPGVWDTLERIAWPKTLDRIATCKEDLVILEAAQLYERGWEKRCDAVVACVADDLIRAERIRQRYAKAGIAIASGKIALVLTQHLAQDEKAKRSGYVIRNDGTLNDLTSETRKTYAQLRADLGLN